MADRQLVPDTLDRRERGDALPYSLPLELTVQDEVTIRELLAYDEGEAREQFALNALRIGVLALRQARGEFDAVQVRKESERLLDGLRSTLDQHSAAINQRLAGTLKEYFDPASGRFHERVERLVRKDGELESLLRRQIGVQDSELCRTLSAHFGEQSDLMKTLSPDRSSGLLATFRLTLDEQLKLQREHVLQQFSLDNKEGALARFIGELTDRQGRLSEQLRGKLDEVVKEFSLDQEGSALSRLVKNVERAQQTITSEFSLDAESSALSRMKKLLEETNRAIDGHLSLDNDQSGLTRLRRELAGLLDEQKKANQAFQEQVKVTLESMVTRRQEAARSTRHGDQFEEVAFVELEREALRLGDVATRTGTTTGLIKNRKWGDYVVELGPDCSAAGARFVVEAKEDKSYSLAKAREEIENARKNRDSQVGLFVFSRKTAPEGLEPLSRYGADVFVVWDADDATSDLYLRTGYTLCRALCVRGRQQSSAQAADFQAMDEAILEIEKRANKMDEMTKWTETIQNNSEKILDEIRKMRKSLEKQVELLREKTADLKESLASSDSSS